MHQREMFHRDLKGSNVLMSTSGLVKLCDLGFANYEEVGWENNGHPGTTWWKAPEYSPCFPYLSIYLV
jgi:serine/threonine protein kinase